MFTGRYALQIPKWITISSSRTFSSTSRLSAGRKSGGRKRTTSEFDIESLPEYQFDSMSKPGYEILFAQAEIRNYLRKTNYELPQLTKFAQTFTPPSSEQILLFKRSYYIGEDHPLQNKVVLTVKMSDLRLTPEQEHKFKLLCGTRFDGRNTFKFSCEKFPHLAQNKKYLSDLIDRLLEAAKDPTNRFDDIPIDLRHIKKKKIIRFPKEWRRSKKAIDANSVNQVSTSDDIAAPNPDFTNADIASSTKTVLVEPN